MDLAVHRRHAIAGGAPHGGLCALETCAVVDIVVGATAAAVLLKYGSKKDTTLLPFS